MCCNDVQYMHCVTKTDSSQFKLNPDCLQQYSFVRKWVFICMLTFSPHWLVSHVVKWILYHTIMLWLHTNWKIDCPQIAKLCLVKVRVLKFRIVHLTQFSLAFNLLVSEYELIYASFEKKEILGIKQNAFTLIVDQTSIHSLDYALGPCFAKWFNVLM